MIKYFKMKQKEIELKLLLYTYAATLVQEKKDIILLINRIYSALKDTPSAELQEKLILEISRLAHEQAAK